MYEVKAGSFRSPHGLVWSKHATLEDATRELAAYQAQAQLDIARALKLIQLDIARLEEEIAGRRDLLDSLEIKLV